MNFELPVGKNIIELDSIDSTNNYLSKLINKTDVPNGTVILAHNQTKGRGQRENVWITENNKNISCSYFVKLNKINISDVFLISMATANAIHKFISSLISGCLIKWPNDILVGKNKICGILIENNISGKNISQSIIGIGININQTNFPKEINATSFALEQKINFDKKALFNKLTEYLKKEINLLNNGFEKPIKNYYLNNLIGYNENRKYINLMNNSTFIGNIKDVENNGLLVIEHDKNHTKFNFKEIEFVL